MDEKLHDPDGISRSSEAYPERINPKPQTSSFSIVFPVLEVLLSICHQNSNRITDDSLALNSQWRLVALCCKAECHPLSAFPHAVLSKQMAHYCETCGFPEVTGEFELEPSNCIIMEEEQEVH